MTTLAEATAGVTFPPRGYGANLAALDHQDAVMVRILAAASERLISDGWCQGQSLDDKGRMCAQHVITTAAYDFNRPDLAMETIFLVDEVLHGRERDFDGTLERWQDQDGRSLDDVLDLFAASREYITRPPRAEADTVAQCIAAVREAVTG